MAVKSFTTLGPGFKVTNAVVYYYTALIAAAKSFIVAAQSLNFLKNILCMAIIINLINLTNFKIG
jgi:hypothetical protein